MTEFLCNYVYIGVLAGMWPCGIITFVYELYLSESKAQVYAYLHEYLQNNLRVSSDLSKSYSLCFTKLHLVFCANVL